MLEGFLEVFIGDNLENLLLLGFYVFEVKAHCSWVDFYCDRIALENDIAHKDY